MDRCVRQEDTIPHALIIDDEFWSSLALENELQALGYGSCDIAVTVRDAIAVASTRRPDLIVADYQLSQGSGPKAVLHICADSPIPVVFVTDYADTVRRVIPDALIIPKPLSVFRLRAMVRAAIDHPFRTPRG